MLKGGELAAFNADVEGMAAYLDTASLADAAADQEDAPCPAGVPDIDTSIVRTVCRTGNHQQGALTVLLPLESRDCYRCIVNESLVNSNCSALKQGTAVAQHQRWGEAPLGCTGT